jgi:hypothetical protein
VLATSIQLRISHLLSIMIGTEQNQPKQLNRLAAQRQLYADAKTVFGWHAFVAGPVAILGAFVGLLLPDAKGYVATWALVVSLCDVLWLTPWQKNLRKSAAAIQESFDCDVLELPWNSLKAGKHPDPEVVANKAAKYQGWAHKAHPLENWYSSRVDELPIELGRIVCQRTNCWWDSTQRRRYSFWVMTGILVLTLLMLGLAMIGGVTVEGLVLKGFVPLGPALLIGVRQVMEHREAADRQDKLKDHSGAIWGEAMAGAASADLMGMCRNLQDEILENRRKAPPVLDFVFTRFRNELELQMNYAAEHYVDEAKQKLGLP